MSNDRITVWRLIAHHAAPADAARWFSQSNVIAIGWGKIGSIEGGRFRSAGAVSEAIRDAYPDLKNSGSGGVCLHDFCFRMERGDLVIVSADGQRTLVMEVEGSYEFKPKPEPAPIGDYQHQRKALPLEIDPDELWNEVGAGPRDGHNIRWTLIECRRTVSAVRKERLLHTGGLRHVDAGR